MFSLYAKNNGNETSKLKGKSLIKQKIYKLIIAILLIIFLPFMLIVIVNYAFFNYNYSEWVREYLNDNKYLVVISEKGKEEKFIGDRMVNVNIKNTQNGKVIANFNTTIDNSSEPLDNENYLLESNNEYILLKFFYANGNTESAYRFYFERL